MSKLSYSMTLRIYKAPPHFIDQGPKVSNATLAAESSVTLPPFNCIMPFEKSVFNRLLKWQENNRIGDCHELDYVGVTTYSPLHSGVSQRTPAWIVTCMGVEREEKVSEWAKLEPGMAVRLFDEGLSEKNHGFEKVWIFGIIGKPYG